MAALKRELPFSFFFFTMAPLPEIFQRADIVFRRSSAVERGTVNPQVIGSNPIAGAKKIEACFSLFFVLELT